MTSELFFFHPASLTRVSERWGLPVDRLEQAAYYVLLRLHEEQRHLELIEIQQRPRGDRYVYRVPDRSAEARRVWAERPLGWPLEQEIQALADMDVAYEGADLPAWDDPVGPVV